MKIKTIQVYKKENKATLVIAILAYVCAELNLLGIAIGLILSILVIKRSVIAEYIKDNLKALETWLEERGCGLFYED